MADGLAVVTVLNNERMRLRKGTGQTWLYNMDIDNPYYASHISGNNVDGLIKTLKTRNHRINTVYIGSFASMNNSIDVNKEMYPALGDNKPRCCFSRDYKGIVKLLCVRARLPLEFVKIGHNSKHQCVVPLILYKDKNGSFIGVNL